MRITLLMWMPDKGSMREKCGVSPFPGLVPGKRVQPSRERRLTHTATARITPGMRTTLRNPAAPVCGIIIISS